MNAERHLIHLQALLPQVDEQTAAKLGHLATLISYATSDEELRLYATVVQLLTGEVHRALN